MNKKEQKYFDRLLWHIHIFYKFIKPVKKSGIGMEYDDILDPLPDNKHQGFIAGYNQARKDMEMVYRRYLVRFKDFGPLQRE